MLKLQPKLKVKETQRIVVSETNYSKEQINSLFELGRFTPVLLYKSKAKKLFDSSLGCKSVNPLYTLLQRQMM